MSIRAKIYLLLGFLLIVFSSCEHRELCFGHFHNAAIEFLVDWSLYTQEKPTGMTVMAYPQDGGQPIKCLTNDITRARMNLKANRYDTFVFNQSVDEFGYVSFRGMDAFHSAEAFAPTTESSWYKEKSAEERELNGERVVDEPEWLATDKLLDIDVTSAMVDSTRNAQQQQHGNLQPFYMGTFTPENIMTTIVVTVHIDGIYNLRSSKAWLSGLAEGYYLGQEKVSNIKVTQLIERWEVRIDETDPTKGAIVATMITFGLPENHTAQLAENALHLSLLLVDNKTVVEHSFSVGNQLKYNGSSERTLYIDVTIAEKLPDVKPDGAVEGGFDTTVDSWGDDEHVDVEV